MRLGRLLVEHLHADAMREASERRDLEPVVRVADFLRDRRDGQHVVGRADHADTFG